MDINRTNIIMFPKVRGAAERAARAQQEARERREAKDVRLRGGAKRAAQAIGSGVVATVRYVLFLVLWWLRGPVRVLLGIASTGSLLALPLLWFGYSAPNKAQMLVALVGVGLGAIAVTWWYDSLLLRLSPEPMILAN